MSQISKRKIDKKIETDLLDALPYIFKELKTKAEMDEFLSSILTKTERLMISKRLLTAYLLHNNVEAGQISDVLKLTNASVTRLKMWISLHKEGFDLVFTKLNKRTAENAAKQLLQRFIKYIIPVAFGRTPNPFKES